MLVSIPTPIESSAFVLNLPSQSVQATPLIWPDYFSFWTQSPPCIQLILAQKPNESPLPSTIPAIKNKHVHGMAQVSKDSTQNPLSVSQLIISNHCSLTTACQPVVHWPKMTVSSCHRLSRLFMTISCKTVSKALLKLECLFPMHFSYSQGLLPCHRRKRDWYWLFYSQPWYLSEAFTDQLFVCSLYWQVSDLITNQWIWLFLLVMGRQYLCLFSILQNLTCPPWLLGMNTKLPGIVSASFLCTLGWIS